MSPSDISIIYQFVCATLLPVITSVVLASLNKRFSLSSRLPYWVWQLVCGIVFGAVAIYGTETGIVTHDATMNVRDAAPLVAGLYFGGPAGIIAGLIGGIERWYAALWGRGVFTRLACSLATAASGFYAAILRRYLLGGRKPSWAIALSAGVVAEVLHMLLILVTNINQAARAFEVVWVCTPPMVGCNALSVALAGAALTLPERKALEGQPQVPEISQRIRIGMLGTVAVGFIATTGFVFVFQDNLVMAKAKSTLSLALYDVSHNLTIGDDPWEAARYATLNCHVGKSGFVAILDADGALVSKSLDDDLSDSDTHALAKAVRTMSPGHYFEITLSENPYFAMHHSAQGLSVVALLPTSEALSERNLAVVVTSFMEVLAFAALFVANYVLVQRVVVESIWQVNGRLGEITRGNLNAKVDVRDSVEFASLSDDINETVAALREAIAAEGARIESDLATARAIQTAALPSTYPAFPDIKAFDLYALMNPAKQVGGDFYDFFLVGERTLAFLIADVSGKGIPGALFMMAAKAELANYLKSGIGLAEAIRSANFNLCQGNDAMMFATAWVATLDWETGELNYVNAGHNPPLLRHNGTWQWLRERGGVFLGAFATADFVETKTVLEPGDELLLYTDGVNEAFSLDEEEYGNDRLEAFLAAHTDLHPRLLVDLLRADIFSWVKGAEQSDDITILALEYGAKPQVTGTIVVPGTDEGIRELVHRCSYGLERSSYDKEVQEYLIFAVTVLLGSAVRHAYDEAGRQGELEIAYIFDTKPNAVTVTLTDHGVPFNPLSPDDVTDRGEAELFADATTGLDDVAYIRDGNDNVIAFRKAW